MTEYLRRAEGRKSAILNDTPDEKFRFESQKFSDIPAYQKRHVENDYQRNDWGAQEVRKYSDLIDAAAARYSIDPDIVKAIIYTEVSRGFYGYAAEKVGLAKTLFPGNISADWQKLIPGSDVRNPPDNIELTTKLISQIAKRLDDPSVENIYSLYNGLSHDRTYVNKEIKTTPYFARMAMEARAWEKDDWHSPEFSNVNEEQRETLDRGRSDNFASRFRKWGTSPAGDIGQPAPGNPATLDQRFGSWGTRYAGGAGASNLPPIAPPTFVGPNIPFVSAPSGSLATPGGSSHLDPVPMNPAASGPFSTGGRFVPRSLPPQPLYPTGALVPASSVRVRDRQGSFDDRPGKPGLPAEDADRFRSPVLRELQRYRQLAASGVAAGPSSAASRPGIPLASSAVGNGTGAPSGGVLKWIGNSLMGSAEASQPNPLPPSSTAPDFVGENDRSSANKAASPLAPDNRRYLSRRIANQASIFDTGAPAVPFISSNAGVAPDQLNSFDDRFGNSGSTLADSGEIRSPVLRQLQRYRSSAVPEGPASISPRGTTPVTLAVQPNMVPAPENPPLGIFSGKPMSMWPLPPQVYGLPDKSGAPDGDDWFRFVAGLAR